MNVDQKKPRVLFIITLFSVGGATETVVTLARGLRRHGYDVTIVSGPHVPSEGDMLPLAQRESLNVIILPELRREIHPVLDILAFLRLFKIIKQGRFDIIHTHSSKAGVLGRIAAWIARARIIVHTIHGSPFHRYQPWFLRRFYVLAERICSKVTSAFVAVSYRIVAESVKEKIGEKNQYSVIRSAFDTRVFSDYSLTDRNFARSLGIQNGDFVIGKISRLSRLKGHTTIINILPQLLADYPGTKVLFIGDGEDRDQIRMDIKKNNLDNHVILTGTVPPTDIPKYLSVMHLVLHTSLHEGLPRVIPQALAMAKPVISYNIDGAPEIVRSGVNGFLIAPSSQRELLDSIKHIIAEYGMFVDNCKAERESVVVEFSEIKMVSDTIALYQKLLDA